MRCRPVGTVSSSCVCSNDFNNVAERIHFAKDRGLDDRECVPAP